MKNVLLTFIIYAYTLAVWSNENQKLILDPRHPLYPQQVVSREIQESIKKDPQATIKILEDLLVQKDHDGKINKNQGPLINSIQSYRQWREAIYLALGRAYYEYGDNEKAIYYYQGIPKESFLYDIGALELGWAYLKDEKLDSVQTIIQNIDDRFNIIPNPYLQKEFQLLKTYHLVKRRKFTPAIELATTIKFPDTTEYKKLKSLHIKVLCQAHFDDYLNQLDKKTISFTEKLNKLNKIISLSESIDKSERDSEFSYLAAESYWHRASVYRIEDPTKYHKQALAALQMADSWITPWVDQSIKQGHALLSEEAAFFSIALLWEQENYQEGIKRLTILPKLFPLGKYLEDSYQMLGDYFYNKNDFKKAVKFYRELAAQGSAQKAPYGVYKAAWCFYNDGDKLKGLRHLERLLLHYRTDNSWKNIEMESKEHGVSRETQQDMLFILAEMLHYNDAIKELEIFKLSPEESIDFQEELGSNYQKIGQYQDAIESWSNLLNTSPEHRDSLEWLINLSRAYLAKGDREEIANGLDRYLNAILKSNNRNEMQLETFESELVNIVLTVHREARKSDNIDDWKAIDKIYLTFDKYFANSKKGEVWYFGAQRKEKRGDKWEAINWYQRAAKIPEYINRQDAAVTTLGLLHTLVEALSLKKQLSDDDVESYKLAVKGSKWYIDNFPHNREKNIAEFIYLEALHYAGDRSTGYQYIVDKFANDQTHEATWNQYIEQNKRLYREKRWEELNLLTNNILKKSKSLNNTERQSLLKIYQESAFLQAFKLEEENSPDNQKIIEWYDIASTPIDTKIYFDYAMALKSWHNSLRTLMVSNKLSNFTKRLQNFQESIVAKKDDQLLNFDERELRLNIFKMASRVFKSLNDMPNRSKMLFLASNYTDNKETKESMIWDSLLIDGSYLDKNSMTKKIEILTEMESSIIKGELSQQTIAKLYLYNHDYRLAWDYLKNLINKKQIDLPNAITLSDLFFQTLEHNKEIHNQVTTLLKEKEKSWRGENSLLPIWSFIDKNEYLKQLSMIDVQNQSRMIASTAQVNLEPAEALKKRANHVYEILNNLQVTKNKISKTINPWQPQLAAIAICEIPQKTEKAQGQLEDLKSPTIDFHQWNEFVKKIDSKINELKELKIKEKDSCNKYNTSIAHLHQLINDQSNFYYSGEIKDKDDIVDLEQSWSKLETQPSTYFKIHSYLKIGALARAEYEISQINKLADQSFYQALLRLAAGDLWNSISLFKGSQQIKDSPFSSSASLFLAAIADNYKQSDKIKQYVENIDSSKLTIWELELYNSIN